MSLYPTIGMLGWPEIVGIAVIVLVLFGSKQVPGMGFREVSEVEHRVLLGAVGATVLLALICVVTLALER